MLRISILLLVCALPGVASADASNWRLTNVSHASKPGLTRFEVQRSDEHGGRVRVVIDPRDQTCPGGATYTVSWRIDGEVKRVGKGSVLLVSFEGGQNAGNRCHYAEPRARAGSETTGALELSWAPGTHNRIAGPGGHEFYIHPEDFPRESQLGQWQVSVPTNAYQDHLWLSIQIDTTGAPGGQFFNQVLLYDAEAPGTVNAPPAGSTGSTGSTGTASRGLEVGVNRYGGDYRGFDVPSGRVEECRAACESEPAQCRAFTLVRAGAVGPQARCWLKSSVPPPTPDPNCTTGLSRVAPTPGFEPGINRYGSDYRGLDVASGRPEECREACKADRHCRSFTLVRAGVSGPQPRCWLKNAVPPATQDGNCTSGVVRP